MVEYSFFKMMKKLSIRNGWALVLNGNLKDILWKSDNDETVMDKVTNMGNIFKNQSPNIWEPRIVSNFKNSNSSAEMSS
jgi:hypothetical protein